MVEFDIVPNYISESKLGNIVRMLWIRKVQKRVYIFFSVNDNVDCFISNGFSNVLSYIEFKSMVY